MPKTNISKNEALTPEYIKELKSKNNDLKNEQFNVSNSNEEIKSKIQKTKLFTMPFETSRYRYGQSLLSKKVEYSWDNYKYALYDYWENQTPKNTLISMGTEQIMYVAVHIITVAAILFELITKGYRNIVNINPISFILFSYAIMEALVGIVSTWYYLIRPNLINRSILKRKLKENNSRLKVIENQLKINDNMVEAYKLSSLNPNAEFANIKSSTLGEMAEIVKYTREDVLPKTDEYIRSRYSVILDKCDEIIELAKENGTIVTEVGKIYRIYLNDINNIILKYNKDNADSVLGLINNFEAYVDRKINKFKGISKMSLESEINALNSAFADDD